MKTRLTVVMAVVLLLGLVFSGPAQTVTAQALVSTTAVTITPETLEDVVYGTYPIPIFTATCNEGFTCEYIGWRLTGGSLPPGMQLIQNSATTARLGGGPAATGNFTFTLEAYDYTSGGSLGSRTYTWTVIKATPVVWFYNMITDRGKTYFGVYATHENTYWDIDPSGTVSVFVDGAPLEACTGMGPVSPGGAYYQCVTSALVGLDPGSHTLRAEFTPDFDPRPQLQRRFRGEPVHCTPQGRGAGVQRPRQGWAPRRRRRAALGVCLSGPGLRRRQRLGDS